MPSFASYGPAKLSALVAYLRTLQGRSKETPLPGDPTRGKILFFGKGKCAECHMVSGQGGFFARDLTAYAAGMDADKVRTAIVNPNKDLDPRRGLVTIILPDSTSLSGVARNEDRSDGGAEVRMTKDESRMTKEIRNLKSEATTPRALTISWSDVLRHSFDILSTFVIRNSSLSRAMIQMRNSECGVRRQPTTYH